MYNENYSIVFSSMTGNTRKLADKIHEVLPKESCDYFGTADALGASLIEGLRAHGAKINGNGSMAIDLTQTSYSTVPSVDVELGNACSDHSDATLENLADGLVQGVEGYF